MNIHPKQAEMAAPTEAISRLSAIIQCKHTDWYSFRRKNYYNYKLATISLDKEPNQNTPLMFP